MPNLKRTLLSTIFAKDIPKLSKYAEEHCLKNYDEASAIYNQILQSSRKDIGTDDFIEWVYKMLEAFKMNSQRARLSTLTKFNKSVQKHSEVILSLSKCKLEKIKKTDKTLVDTTIEFLFDNLRLTQTNSPLVTFSKTMHFLLPDLFMPIDRKYTLQFFYKTPPYKRKNYSRNRSREYQREDQRQRFFQVFEEFRLYANENRKMLKEQVNPKSRWNRNIPKIIDNIIIAQVTRNMER